MQDQKLYQSNDTPRAKARRDQILAAAAVCFTRHGFHACSMTEIAAEAGMSVGHIYRYFKNKDAISIAIIRADVQHVMTSINMANLRPSDFAGSFAAAVSQQIKQLMSEAEASLWIEVRAEAARNPSIAAVVRDADEAIGDHLRDMIRTATTKPLSEVQIAARVELCHLVLPGLILRKTINPGLSDSIVDEVIKRLAATIFS